MNKKKFIAKTCLIQLSSVEEKIRNKGFRSIQQHIDTIDPQDFKNLGLGLYYYYWYSDKTSKQLKFLWDIRSLFERVAMKDMMSFWKFIREFLDVIAEKFVKIDIYRTSKYLLLAKFIFHLMYGVDLESVLFDSDFKEEAKKTKFYDSIWDKEEMRNNICQINQIIIDVLMECTSRKGLLLQYIYAVRDLYKRLFKLNRFKMMKELFLFSKPLLNLTAFTWNKNMRKTLQEDFLEHLFKVLTKRGYKARSRFGKFVLIYAKSPDLQEINRNILYDFLEKVEEKPTNKKPKNKIEVEEEKENDMEDELDEIDKELSTNKNIKSPKEDVLDVKKLNIGKLVKRHYDNFTNEEVPLNGMEDDFDDEEYSPFDDLELMNTLDTQNNAQTGHIQHNQGIEIEEEAENATELSNGSENKPQLGEVNGHGKENNMNGKDIKENGHMEDNKNIFEMDMDQYDDFNLPDLDVQEEDGEFTFGHSMSFEEMQKKLPEYYFKSPKQKKKYFKKLTMRYKKNLDKSSNGTIKRKKIHFDLSKNEKLLFNQNEIINKN